MRVTNTKFVYTYKEEETFFLRFTEDKTWWNVHKCFTTFHTLNSFITIFQNKYKNLVEFLEKFDKCKLLRKLMMKIDTKN